MLLLLPLDWLLSAVTAAVFHEFCHIAAVRLFGGSVRKISVSCSGCVIDCSELEDPAKVLSILAGPAGSLSLLCVRGLVPQIAVCGLLQGLYNLLPVLPLDGGRVLELLLLRVLPKQTAAILSGVKDILVLLTVCLLLRFRGDSAGILPVVVAGILILRWIYEKFLAKRLKSGYNRLKSFYEVKL